MRRVGSILAVIFWVAVVAGGVVLAAVDFPGEKSYHFPRVEIDARIRPDGTLSLRERRTFDFTGEFSYAYFTVESTHAPIENIEGFTIRERGQELFHTVDESGNDFSATWYF
jgi:hypothetical protein